MVPRHTPPARRLAQLVSAVALQLAFAAPVMAHDVEKTHVLVTFGANDTYQVDVLNDADWMWIQLAPGTEPLPATDERNRQLAQLTGRFAQTVRLVFDGHAARIEGVEFVPPADADPTSPTTWTEPGTMRIVGRAPGVRTFQFAYDLVEDPYPLTLTPARGEPVTRWLMTGELSEAFEIAALRPMTRLQVSRQYLGLGFTHILPKGLDHILFVVGLFLLSTKLKPLLLQITAFTVAHTITLGLTIYGVVSLPPEIVEPLIALSIAYVGVENLATSQLRPWRVGLVFAFGLLHGMGFAGVLADLGLPRSEFLTALVTFNAGVELGQLAVVGLAFIGVVGLVDKDWYRRRVTVPLSVTIAAVGMFWTLERLGLVSTL